MRLRHRAAVITAVAGVALAAASPALAATASVGTGTGTGTGANVNVNVGANVPAPFAGAGSVVSAGAGKVTVKLVTLDGKGGTATYPVAEKAVILLDGRTVALSALPAGARIVVVGTVTGGTTYSAKSLTALSRWQLNLNGTVSAVDAAKGTVTVNTGTPAAAVKLNVDPKANIELNGVKVGLSNLPVGATVNLNGTETTAGATVAGIDAKLGTARPRA
ncbi:hypothetical protein [Paractinoplanes lichenicola]|uniref:DUF5666 domain-containing protein n=1 Tax=Paractinoplanes lichenicola TaxID=2802976 RepID=A0ABS1W2S1_9ACTN|nr:hypothetical protein [Actinoplanes lichenicola]MBL7261032.1 hypothetical protein [Actinoplanes lichenicola]